MGAAKRRGTFEARKAEAVEALHLKQTQAAQRPQPPAVTAEDRAILATMMSLGFAGLQGLIAVPSRRSAGG